MRRLKRANADVRAEMSRYGISQAKLGELLGKSTADICKMLGMELATEEQFKLIKIIKEVQNEK